MEGKDIETDQNRANIGKGWIVVRDCRLFRLGRGAESFVNCDCSFYENGTRTGARVDSEGFLDLR